MGPALGVTTPEIRNIESNELFWDRFTDANRCLKEIISIWLKRGGNKRSWEFLANVMRKYDKAAIDAIENDSKS